MSTSNVNTKASGVGLILVVGVIILIVCLLSSRSQPRLLKIPLERRVVASTVPYKLEIVHFIEAQLGQASSDPASKFKFALELNSDDTWIPVKSKKVYDSNLHFNNGFDCSKSPSCRRISQKTKSINYISTQLDGTLVGEVMTLSGDYVDSEGVSKNHLLAFEHTFLQIERANNERLERMPFDGSIGLGTREKSEAGSRNLLLSITVDKNQALDRHMFSLWLSPDLDSAHGGELVLGGRDESHFTGDIFWHKTIPPARNTTGSWLLRLNGLEVGSPAGPPGAICSSGCVARLSSAIGDVVGPARDIRALHTFLGAKLGPHGLAIVDCSTANNLPTIVLTIDATKYQMLPSNYVRRAMLENSKDSCYLALTEAPDGSATDEWILGTSFLGAYYSTYDIAMKRVGFASAK